MMNSEFLKEGNSSVLVIDDQFTSRTILSQIVQGMSSNTTIVEKSNPELALEWATENTADLVIVDYVMPEMNGIDFVRLLKKLSRYEFVPIIMITIKKDSETRNTALDAGVTDFLSKPINMHECSSRSKNLLTMRKQHVALQSKTDYLERRVKAATFEIRTREKETLMRLARAGEYKDSDTAMHLQRMSLYSRAIAEALGFSEEDAEAIELSAPLHDIGKIGIPDSILTKKGELDSDEMSLMKTHPQIGYDILENSPSKYLQMGGEIALAHHERFDGSGYPNALSGKQIPLSARIVAIADVLDALTSKRSYKHAWNMDKAFEYLVEESGKHFDPDLIIIALSIRKKLQTIHDAHSVLTH